MAYKFNAFQKRWLKALESGEYAQTKQVLCNGKGFCCLGVACDLAGVEWRIDADGDYVFEGESTVLPESVRERLQMIGCTGQIKGAVIVVGREKRVFSSLADANDDRASFKTIAKFIRANPESVFKS